MKTPDELTAQEWKWINDHMDEVVDRLERIEEIVSEEDDDEDFENRSHLKEARSFAESYHLQVRLSKPDEVDE